MDSASNARVDRRAVRFLSITVVVLGCFLLIGAVLTLSVSSLPAYADEDTVQRQKTLLGPESGPLTDVSISGPTTGDVGVGYGFTATVRPVSATMPIAYVWRTTDQSPVTDTGNRITGTVVYTWTTPGTKTLVVTATNAVAAASTIFTVTITQGTTPPMMATLWGPKAGGTNNPVWIASRVDPLTATLPMTYVWQTDGQKPLTFVRTPTYDSEWSGRGGFNGQWTWASFTWETVGPKVITFTATNAGGVVTATHTVAISLSPVVVITGPVMGQVTTTYTFTAAITPITTSLPIYYSWKATEQPYTNRTGEISDTITYTWSTSGTKVIQVWVHNQNGWSEDALLFEIPTPWPPLSPTIESSGSGDWNSPTTWNLSRTPVLSDVVLIHAGHTVTTAAPLGVESLVNRGTLLSTGGVPLIITATNVLSNSGLIRAGDGLVSVTTLDVSAPNWHPACNGTGGMPGAPIIISASWTYNNGVIQAGNGVNGGSGGDVTWAPTPNTTLWNDTGGVIRGGDGGNGTSGGGGGPGGDVTITGKPIDNDGLIQAGDGGDGDQCGGDGGSTYIFGENTTNTGDIYAGDGGDTTDNLATAHGGDGGDTEVWGKFFTGSGFLINLGDIAAGDGGDGSPTATTNPQHAGCGGDLTLMAMPNVFLSGGTHAAGVGGIPSAGGRRCAGGRVMIDPASISLMGSGTRITGLNVSIYGGDDWTLDLKNLNSEVVSATGHITLAVGSGGVIDLSGNTSRILQAGGQVRLYADRIILDPGVPLFALAGTNVITGPGRILRHVSVVAPRQVSVRPGDEAQLTFTVLNAGAVTDTFTLSAANSASWSMSGLPASITIGGLDHRDVTLTVTVPAGASDGSVGEVTFVATSQTDADAKAQEDTLMVVQARREFRIYLPLILRHSQ